MRLGEFIHEKRIAKEMTLREFCKTSGLDCVFISGLERGVENCPLEKDFYKKVAKALNLSPSDTLELKKLSKSSNLVPQPPLHLRLPVFLPPNLTDAQIEDLIDLIKKS